VDTVDSCPGCSPSKFQVVITCGGCGAKAIDSNPTICAEGHISYICEVAHGDACPFLRDAKTKGEADLEWLTLSVEKCVEAPLGGWTTVH
jgi:hypothetical protein